MDPQNQHDPMAMDTKGQEDDAMAGVEGHMSTAPAGNYGQGQPMQSQAPESYPSNGSFSPQPESDPASRYVSSNSGYQYQQQAPIQPYSRPSSGLSGSGHQGYPQNYQDGGAQRQDATGRTQSSVVIKVGMVGDAQIGKTSLMVKYVEGSWDEDYIQTLGRDA